MPPGQAAKCESIVGIGQHLGRYRLIEHLGRGASAEVYLAVDSRLHRDVAIKVFRPDLVREPRIRKKFFTEARIHARLEHANIVRIYDLLESDNRTFLVMRHVRGSSLAELARSRGGRLPWHAAVLYTRQVLEGMAYAHARGVLHQDLKPQNILVTRSHEAIVVDFGVAALLEELRSERQRVNGSPAYMAPEQIRGRYLDARCDIYAIGMTLYQLATGRHPFGDARTIDEMLKSHLERRPCAASCWDEAIPKQMDELLDRALAKVPEDRFRSCEDMLTALVHLEEPDRSRLSANPLDLRWDPRAEIALRARATLPDGQVHIDLHTINLSAGGMALFMHHSPTVGSNLFVEIEPPEQTPGGRVRVEVEVIAVASLDVGVRVGARFIAISDRDRRRIRDWVRDRLILGELKPSLELETVEGPSKGDISGSAARQTQTKNSAQDGGEAP